MYNRYNRIMREVKGFTLIELLAVMAIVGVLAAIISLSVAGSGQTSRDTQTVQDGTTIETAQAEFFGIQTGAASIDTNNYQGPFTQTATATETTSSLFPEEFITTTYDDEFPDTGSSSNKDTFVNTITIFEEDGTTITLKTLLDGFAAVDFDALEAANVLTFTPESFTSTDTIALLGQSPDYEFHNFIWLLEKDTAASSGGSTVDSRNVAIYKLLTVEKVDDPDNTGTKEKVDLTFIRIF